MEHGSSARATAQTGANDTSSRSHAVFIIARASVRSMRDWENKMEFTLQNGDCYQVWAAGTVPSTNMCLLLTSWWGSFKCQTVALPEKSTRLERERERERVSHEKGNMVRQESKKPKVVERSEKFMEGSQSLTGRLNLVDLAGSERPRITGISIQP